MIVNHAPHLAASIANMRFASSALDDIEEVKIAQENRLRTLTRSEPDVNLDLPSSLVTLLL